jgi:hypothetical protein
MTALALAAVITAACVATAKRAVPLTQHEAKIIWQLHKQNTACQSHKYQPITRKQGEITGFQCQCGYRYVQRRPLLSRMPKQSTLPNINRTSSLTGAVSETF